MAPLTGLGSHVSDKTFVSQEVVPAKFVGGHRAAKGDREMASKNTKFNVNINIIYCTSTSIKVEQYVSVRVGQT